MSRRSEATCSLPVFADFWKRVVPKDQGAAFIGRHHLLDPLADSSYRGLWHSGEIVAVAAFSGGRSMRRLPAGKKSFELLRFATIPGVTVQGGLSKLVKNFSEEKGAGDIMSYVDLQLGNGLAFQRAGFSTKGTTGPIRFLLHRQTLKREKYKAGFDPHEFALYYHPGSLKMIYSSLSL